VTVGTVALLVAGLLALAGGAEALVRGASRLALAAGVSPLVIGLTVVAWGTSTPELVVSVLASARGQVDVALANVVGSNVFNVLLILGACAAITPLAVSRQLWRREVPIMIGASVLLLGLAADGRLARLEGAILLAGIVAWTAWSMRASRREPAAAQAEARRGAGLDRPPRRLAVDAALVLAGLALLVLGARWVVDAAVALARAAGVSDVVIGLTVVAAGTSLPEAATSILATLRGERDIAIGNVVGSNVYNVLAIAGLAAAVAPGALVVHPALLGFDLPFMIAVSVACLPLFFTARTLSRWEGFLFLGYYAAYVAYVVLQATRHDALPAFSAAMWLFVAPLTAVTIAVLTVRAVRADRAAAPADGAGAPGCGGAGG
jgi:cation:H+ antiporter